MALAIRLKMSTVGLTPPKGKPKTKSRINSRSRTPATPMEPQHNHFSMNSPFTACIVPTLAAPLEGPCLHREEQGPGLAHRAIASPAVPAYRGHIVVVPALAATS